MLTAKKIAHILNEAHSIDPAAISSIFNVSKICNNKLAEHPYLIVKSEGNNNFISFLGIINGMLTAAGSEDVVILHMDADENVLEFSSGKHSNFITKNEYANFPTGGGLND